MCAALSRAMAVLPDSAKPNTTASIASVFRIDRLPDSPVGKMGRDLRGSMRDFVDNPSGHGEAAELALPFEAC